MGIGSILQFQTHLYSQPEILSTLHQTSYHVLFPWYSQVDFHDFSAPVRPMGDAHGTRWKNARCCQARIGGVRSSRQVIQRRTWSQELAVPVDQLFGFLGFSPRGWILQKLHLHCFVVPRMRHCHVPGWSWSISASHEESRFPMHLSTVWACLKHLIVSYGHKS